MAKFSICGSIVVALLATLLFVEVQSTGIERIIGGERAKPGQFPHQVTIRATRSRSYICAGAIIRDQFVLTVADCMQKTYSDPANVYVIAGAISLSADYGTPYNVSKITNHPQFNRRTMLNDISVIKIASKIAFTNLVKATNLPTRNVAGGVATTISGWGRYDVSTD